MQLTGRPLGHTDLRDLALLHALDATDDPWPSSSRPNFSGEETNVVLPFSRVRGSISTLYWQDSDPDDLRHWIAPHVPVALSSADYFENHDPAMAAVLQIIAGSN